MNRILVIGSSGNIGREVVDQLTAAGARFRAMTRNPDAAGLPPQVEVVRGDLTVPETLDPCLEDVDTVFLVWVAPPAAAPAALERIANHARRIVFLTAPLKTPHPFFQQPNPARVLAERLERLIETLGTGVDIPPGRHVRRKRAAFLGAADSRWRCRALAVPRGANGSRPMSVTWPRSRSARCAKRGMPARSMW